MPWQNIIPMEQIDRFGVLAQSGRFDRKRPVGCLPAERNGNARIVSVAKASRFDRVGFFAGWGRAGLIGFLSEPEGV